MALIDLIKKNYKTKVTCANCGYIGEVSIPFGTTIVEYIGTQQAKCRTCGCSTLIDERMKIRLILMKNIKSSLNGAEIKKRLLIQK